MKNLIFIVSFFSLTFTNIFCQFKCGDTLVDSRDGTKYNTVLINGQCWMAEDLNCYTKGSFHYDHDSSILIYEFYENNDPFLELFNIDKNTLNSLTSFSTNSFSSMINSCDVRHPLSGTYYTWEAAMNGTKNNYSNQKVIQGVCPDGWHIPSDDEWKELEIFLGMSEKHADKKGEKRGTIQGDLLKYDDSIGFNVSLGGIFCHESSMMIVNSTRYWTSTVINSKKIFREFSCETPTIRRVFYKYNSCSHSVRCVKD